MHKLNEKGDLLVPLVVAVFLLVCTLGFSFWAFAGRQDYKNNVDTKVAEAVKTAEENLTIKKDAEFAETAKLPFVTYQGPSAFGTVTVAYPKTWSAYVDETGGTSLPLSVYMHPAYVPAVKSSNFAFRFEVTSRAYADEMTTYTGLVKAGKVTSAAYRLPKVESVLGSRMSGEIISQKQGELIILPLRDKTLKIWTEGESFKADFEKILESLTFVP